MSQHQTIQIEIPVGFYRYEQTQIIDGSRLARNCYCSECVNNRLRFAEQGFTFTPDTRCRNVAFRGDSDELRLHAKRGGK